MSRTYDIIITNSKGDFRLPISLETMIGQKLHFSIGYKGKPIRMIRVSPKADVAVIHSVADIDCIVPYDQTESLLAQDDGYVVIKKSALKNIYPNNPDMAVKERVKMSSISPSDYEGSHYFINLRPQTKGKKAVLSEDDITLYNVIWKNLQSRSEGLVVIYNQCNHQKRGLLWADGDGLRMSVLICSNYRNKHSEQKSVDVENGEKLYDRLLKKYEVGVLSIFVDSYRTKIMELIEKGVIDQPVQLGKLSQLDDD